VFSLLTTELSESLKRKVSTVISQSYSPSWMYLTT